MTTPISVQLYTIREAIAADAIAALQRLAALGFDTVEGFALPQLADRYAEALPAAGLAMPTCHASLCSSRGVDPEWWTTRADVEQVAAELSAIAPRAAGVGALKHLATQTTGRNALCRNAVGS